MRSCSEGELGNIYPVCRSILGREAWDRMVTACGKSPEPEPFPETLAAGVKGLSIPDFLPELAVLECARTKASTADVHIPQEVDQFEINPTLDVLHLSWRLSSFLNSEVARRAVRPQPGEEWALVWREPKSGKTNVQAASDDELVAIKIVVDGIPPEQAAESGTVPVHVIDALLFRAAEKGLLIAPRSCIRRDTSAFPDSDGTPERYLTADAFTLQWHITHACDLRCKHCYDRSKRSPLTLDQGLTILEDLRAFCRGRHVKGHVCLTGGNPFMYPHFLELYQGAAERGFTTSILGNPASKKKIERLLEIQRPGYFQVSLEGLPAHNDTVRGPRHFASVIEFLRVLRELGVSSAVMLTLTADNIDQVLPLAEILRERADYFTFNRLSPVGEGANLQLPSREEYAAFLESYVDAARGNPIMGFKDNLINTVLHRRGMELFDGCTGYGCGAAFNFIAVLPDGEAHACRKFPSPIGNVLEQSIAEIYDSDIANRYRGGSRACRSCCLRPVCGGCLATAYGHGLDIFNERDPHCFGCKARNGASRAGALV